MSSSGPKKSRKHKSKRNSIKAKVTESFSDASDEHIEIDNTIIDDGDISLSIDDETQELEEPTSDHANSSKLKTKVPTTPPDKELKGLQKVKGDKSKSSNSSKKSSKKKDGSHKGDDDTDSEEERWLDAIESGKLEEVDDELKRMKNPRLMTARQRALMEKRHDVTDDAFHTIPAEPLLALPSGFKEKVVTEEMLAKKAIKSKRRREQAKEKREEDKKKTVDRLLKKQDSRISKLARSKNFKKEIPLLTFIDNKDGMSLSLPVGYSIPLEPQHSKESPKPSLCGIKNCQNIKKYSCSRTGVPLCSLECYKKNLSLALQLPVTSS